MEVIPAIDLRGGKCVRLYQGDYGQETVYSESPVATAFHWDCQGASRIHVVDLDGAKEGSPVHLEVVTSIASSVGASIQYGGGVRTVKDARDMISSGVARVILGTAAVEDSKLINQIGQEMGFESVIVSIDVLKGYVAVRGWAKSSRVSANELMGRIEAMGVERFVYTDVTRDGTLTEPNFDAIGNLSKQTGMKMLVAGGISSLDHIKRLRQIGIEAAIVGKAAYTGDIDIRDAIAVLSGSTTD